MVGSGPSPWNPATPIVLKRRLCAWAEIPTHVGLAADGFLLISVTCRPFNFLLCDGVGSFLNFPARNQLERS